MWRPSGATALGPSARARGRAEERWASCGEEAGPSRAQWGRRRGEGDLRNRSKAPAASRKLHGAPLPPPPPRKRKRKSAQPVSTPPPPRRCHVAETEEADSAAAAAPGPPSLLGPSPLANGKPGDPKSALRRGPPGARGLMIPPLRSLPPAPGAEAQGGEASAPGLAHVVAVGGGVGGGGQC